MKVKGRHYRTVWMEGSTVFLIDQTRLPFRFQIIRLSDYQRTCQAIKNMVVRGAGAIGATAGFAMAQAFLLDPKNVKKAKKAIEATRPTAQNLFYAVNRVFNSADPVKEAQAIADEDAESCRQIGLHGSKLINNGSRIETHCNAGWLAFVDYGSALSPIYTARDQAKKVFVYVDETRPRSQGARLTAWELLNEKIPHKIIPDNTGAFLMSRGEVDLMIVGADRIAANGDVANKIGTLEKAIAAKYYGIPFYVAAPSSTFDPNCKTGKDIPIEERSDEEILYQAGPSGKPTLVVNPGSRGLNLGFDVTPAELITGIITENGLRS